MVMRPLAVTAALAIAGGVSLGWTIARKLTAPVGPRTFGLVVRGVEMDGDRQFLVLDRTRDTEAPGIHNLWFEYGGWAQLAEEVQDRGLGQVARVVTGSSPDLRLREGDRVSWSGIYYATPGDAGVDARDVVISTPAGPAPAWRVDGDLSTWAIHIHGLGVRGRPRSAAYRSPRN